MSGAEKAQDATVTAEQPASGITAYPERETPAQGREPRICIVDSADCSCPNQHPHLDEFVARDVTVHFEAMGDAQFWIGVEDKATGRFWHINCGAVNEQARGYAHVEEDSP